MFSESRERSPTPSARPAMEAPGENDPADSLPARSTPPAKAALDPPPAGTGHPPFMSPHARPIAVSGGLVFAANTPADTVDVIDTSSRDIVARIKVGIDPVGMAVRPDGKEVWVANHVSDSVSVIDADSASPSYLQVIATVQDLDPVTRATRFDEPVGIAFANNDKAYVALSSENQIAVIDVATRQVVKKLAITAQDPRAIAVRGNRLYVIPFESNNQTQMSGCSGIPDGDLCTFTIQTVNNVLSTGLVVDIVKHPRVPDRDLYIFDTATDALVDVVDTLGTLLYGLAVDSAGRVFIAQTDARNDANGRAGTQGHGLAEMENRAFLNQITRVDFNGGFGPTPQFFELEPLPPAHPQAGMALATPFAIQISQDDSILVVSAAGSDKLFTVDAASGEVLGRVDVDAVPRGIALESAVDGLLSHAWVLNAVANTVSVVNVADPLNPQVLTTIPLEDPTHPAVKRGRIAFNDADASTTGTFSCESCHPDGNTDQLLWVLDTPLPTGGTQIPPRITMPIRGLRDTAPFHWDGIPGDPYGGNNTANIWGSDPPNSDPGVPESSTRHLIDGGLASTMKDVNDFCVNDEGKLGALTAAERDDMAKFLLSVPYPPAQRRSYDNILSATAMNGFRIFHIDGIPTPTGLNTCGDCHRMPFWVTTNTPGTGMEAPTWRGAYDRWLILPQGRQNMVDQFSQSQLDNGISERDMWVGITQGSQNIFSPAWNMVTEGSTGFSGSFARQVTLNQTTADAASTHDLLDALEIAAAEDGLLLLAEGVFIDVDGGSPVALRFDGRAYVERGVDPQTFTRDDLVSLAAQGAFVGTFTGRLGPAVDVDNPQPAIWSQGPIQIQRGRQRFPTLSPDEKTMVLSGRHIQKGARLFVDGRRVAGNLTTRSSAFFDDDVVIELETLPPDGMHLLQIQNPKGLFSNEYIFFTAQVPDEPIRWIPHITAREGSFKTALTVSNNGLHAGTVSLQPYTASGAKLTPRQIDVAGRSFETMESEALFPGEDVSHFSINGEGDLVVTAAYRVTSGAGSTAHVNESRQRGHTFYIYPGDWNIVWDGMALVNLGDRPNRIRIGHIAEDGTLLAQRVHEDNLAPFAKSLAVFGETFDNVPHSLIRIQANQEIAVLFLRGTHAGTSPSALYQTVPLPAKAGHSRLLSHVTPPGGDFTSTLYFTNFGSAPANLILRPFDASGNALAPQTVTIPALASSVSHSTEVFPGLNVSHYEIDGPADCVATIGYAAANGFGATAHVNENPVLSGNDVQNFILYQGEWSGEFDGMAIVNLGDTPAEIHGFQYDREGQIASNQLLHTGLAPSAKHLLVFESVFENRPDQQIFLSATQPAQVIFLRGTKPGANILYPIEPVPLVAPK